MMIQNPWWMLALLFAVRTAMGFQFQTIGSTAPFLEQSLGIDGAQLGLLIGFYFLPGIFIALPGGLLGQRFGAPRVAQIGLILMTIGGVISGIADTFTMAAAGRLIAGVGGVFLNVMLTKLIADWFPSHRLTTAMSLLVMSWPFGIALGSVVDYRIAATFGWQAVLLFSAAIVLLVLVLMAAMYRDPPDLHVPPMARMRLGLNRQETTLVVVAGAIWAAFNAAYIVLISFAPQFFHERGFPMEQASWISSLLGYLLIPLIPAGGYLTDRIGRPILMMIFGFIVCSAAIVLMVSSATPIFWLIVVTIGSLPSGAIMTLPVAAVRPEFRSTGMGVYYTLYYAGMGSLPAVAGLARDRTGDATAPLLFSALLLVVALLLLLVFVLLRRVPSRVETVTS
jgi:predicted MFS family arabinose efflux permease